MTEPAKQDSANDQEDKKVFGVEGEITEVFAAAETEEAPPQKQMTRRVGERSPPGRDPVGPTEKAVEKPEKCPFSVAAVNLFPEQLTQAESMQKFLT